MDRAGHTLRDGQGRVGVALARDEEGCAKTTYFYHRFAIFLLPGYAVAFRSRGLPRARDVVVEMSLALACGAFFLGIATRERRFSREAAPFETVLAATSPGERALQIVLDAHSDATRHPWAYHAYALWYQVDRGGFVDFNFATLLPELVRFRPEALPPMTSDVESPDWRVIDPSRYRYFFVRHTAPIPSGLFDNARCDITLLREAGPWAVYEREACR